LSLRTGSLKPHLSGTTKLDSPDALMDSNATITAREKRRTAGIVALALWRPISRTIWVPSRFPPVRGLRSGATRLVV